MNKHYKIGIVGLGSIGTRHLYNIVDILKDKDYSFKIDLIRNSLGKKLDEKIKKIVSEVFYSFESVPSNYDVIFVTNPTYLHYETVKQLAPKTKHMFIEKPIFDQIDSSIEELSLKKDMTYYIACPLRYTNVIQYLKNKCNLQKVYSVRVISSSYLPDWRPNVDYRNTYSADSSQGGGVSIDLIHEWDYLYYLFGLPEHVINLNGKFSHLEINSEDLSIYIAKYKNMVLELHLDYFGRKPIREIQIFTEEDTIVGDLINSEVRFLKNDKTISFKELRNDFQRKEIIYFFDIIEGREINHNDILTAMQTLKIAKEGIRV